MKLFYICGILLGFLALTACGCAEFSALNTVTETGQDLGRISATPAVRRQAQSSRLTDGIDFFINEKYAINLNIGRKYNQTDDGAFSASFDFDEICPVLGCKYYF